MAIVQVCLDHTHAHVPVVIQGYVVMFINDYALQIPVKTVVCVRKMELVAIYAIARLVGLVQPVE